MHTIYGMSGDDVWWAASDMGWVVGHSYICYGPLSAGLTSVMYEGKPDRTPDPGQYFRYVLGIGRYIAQVLLFPSIFDDL